jgi:hypothetical protein
MDQRTRLTPLGAVLILLLLASIAALFLGSKGLQAAGFVVALIVIIVLIADRLPRMRVGGGHDLGMDAPTLRRRRERSSVEDDSEGRAQGPDDDR